MVLSDGSAWVIGGWDYAFGIKKNDVWKTVDGGVTWVLVTFMAGTGRKSIEANSSLHILLGEYSRRLHRYSVSHLSFAYVMNLPWNEFHEPQISGCDDKCVLRF